MKPCWHVTAITSSSLPQLLREGHTPVDLGGEGDQTNGPIPPRRYLQPHSFSMGQRDESIQLYRVHADRVILTILFFQTTLIESLQFMVIVAE